MVSNAENVMNTSLIKMSIQISNNGPLVWGYENQILLQILFRLAPGQRETSLQSNVVSHWLGANLESALLSYFLFVTPNDYSYRHSVLKQTVLFRCEIWLMKMSLGLLASALSPRMYVSLPSTALKATYRLVRCDIMFLIRVANATWHEVSLVKLSSDEYS